MLSASDLSVAVITPNERSARSEIELYDQQCIDRGSVVWPTLCALSWKAFTEELYDELCLSGAWSAASAVFGTQLMSRWQERFLWLKVVQASEAGQGLLHQAATAQEAAAAYELACGYRLFPLMYKQRGTWEHETEVFLDWSERFDRACRERDWFPLARLEQQLLARLPDDLQGLLPPKLCLRGFSTLDPLSEQLLAVFEERGIEVVREEPPNLELLESPPAGWGRLAPTDAAEELVEAARWARRKLEEDGRADRKTRLPLALVVPDLSERREEVLEVLDRVLHPSTLLVEGASAPRAYNVSLGRSLSAYPLVADALAFLRLEAHPVPLAVFSALFHSPFLAGAERERLSRAMLEVRLLRLGAYRIPLRTVVDFAAKEAPARPASTTSPAAQGAQAPQPPPYACPILAERLRTLEQQARSRTGQRWLPSEWAELWSQRLQGLGWPGERPLDSSEFQARDRFWELLSGFGALDKVLGRTSLPEALSTLNRIADETVFAPKLPTTPGASLQVLGLLEAAGLPFEAVWLCGLHDGAWPASARPNPYLPGLLAKEFGVPHSSAEREYEFAATTSALFLARTCEGVISCPHQEGDRQLRPSQLFRRVPELSPRENLGTLDPLADQFGSAELELLEETTAPPLALENPARGGSALFRYQMLCPFRAFAALRLQARPFDQLEEGLSSAQRGDLLHFCLEEFWIGVRTLEDWKRTPSEERAALIRHAAERAVERVSRNRPDVLRGAYRDIEVLRLGELLREWLEVEEARPPFEVVATEEPLEFEFGGLRLSALVDRVDRTPEGDLLLIDYKTGDRKHNEWRPESLREPQLPLYAVTWLGPVAGLAFARVRPGEMAFSGLTARAGLLPDVKPSSETRNFECDWQELRARWTDILLETAQHFAQGRAEVEPISRSVACAHCGLESLCRIDEIELRIGAES